LRRFEGEVHRIVYEAGIDEHVIPDELEANTLLQYFDLHHHPGSEYVLTISCTLDEDIIKVEDITHDVAVSGNPFKYMVPEYFRPLEAVNRFESNAIHELAYYGNGGLNEDRKLFNNTISRL
jgi:hypothetical protein